MKTFETLPAPIQSMVKDVIKMKGIGAYQPDETLDTSVFESDYNDGIYTFKYNGVPLKIGVKMDDTDQNIISATYNPNAE